MYIKSFLSFFIISLCLSKPLTDISHIKPGFGFSSDTETIAKIACFKTKDISYNRKRVSISRKVSPMSFQDLVKEFGYLSITEKYQFFLSSDLLMDYLNEIYYDDYSFSFNYIVSKVEDTEIEYAKGKGSTQRDFESILSHEGILRYKHDTTYKFRLNCGDRLISSFTSGIGLIYSVKITFTNPMDKKKFSQRFSDYNEFYFSISKLVRYLQEKIQNPRDIRLIDPENGIITILAIQLGGNSKEINEIIEKNSKNGKFVFAKCTFKNIEPCIRADNYGTKFIESYVERFSNQVSNFNDLPKDQLVGMGAVHKSFETNPLINFGIYLTSSLVTPLIAESRELMLKKINEIKTLLNHVKYWKKFLPKNEKINSYYFILKTNLNLFLEDEQGVTCYRDILNFKECFERIQKALMPYEKEEIINLSKELKFSDYYYEVSLKGNFCLPSIMEWENDILIDIHFIDDVIVRVITNSSEIKCSVTGWREISCINKTSDIRLLIEEKNYGALINCQGSFSKGKVHVDKNRIQSLYKIK